jgi:hypothetical protein
MATWENIGKPGNQGSGQLYDDLNLEYDALTDPDSGNSVFYDGIGQSQVWTNEPKS